MIDRLTALFEPAPRTAEDWLVRMRRPVVSSRDQAAFEAWLAADDANEGDYAALKQLLHATGALRSAFTAEFAALPRPRSGRPPLTWPGAVVPAFGMFAALALVAMVWSALMSDAAREPVAEARIFSTGVGEIRDVVLADGSRVTLDTATALHVTLNGPLRRVAVERGAAFFAVTPDPARRFEVALADRAVIVTGTRFVTTLRGGEARVAVIEGSVAVMGAGDPLRLAPGDQITYRPGEPARRAAPVDPLRTAAWRERRLVFEDAALSDVLAELSRYTDVRLVAVDPALARQRVTAVFPLTGPEPLTERIDRLFPVALIAAGPGRVEVRAE